MLLTYFDPKNETVNHVNASNSGLNTTLSHEAKPIAFASKYQTETEQQPANIERDLLAVVFGCERF